MLLQRLLLLWILALGLCAGSSAQVTTEEPSPEASPSPPMSILESARQKTFEHHTGLTPSPSPASTPAAAPGPAFVDFNSSGWQTDFNASDWEDDEEFEELWETVPAPAPQVVSVIRGAPEPGSSINVQIPSALPDVAPGPSNDPFEDHAVAAPKEGTLKPAAPSLAPSVLESASVISGSLAQSGDSHSGGSKTASDGAASKGVAQSGGSHWVVPTFAVLAVGGMVVAAAWWASNRRRLGSRNSYYNLEDTEMAMLSRS